MTPEEARDLLKNTTPGPWRLHEVKGYPHLRYITTGTGHSGDPTAAVCIPVDVTSREGAANMTLKAAAPDMAHMIAAMHEEWVGQYLEREGKWATICAYPTREEVAHHLDHGCWDAYTHTRIVRRYVTEPEEIT